MPDEKLERKVRENDSGEGDAYPGGGFGASASRLQALREILQNLDPETGLSLVVVTQLAPDQKSFLSEIVERYPQMPVSAVEPGGRPLPNHLYVLQPDQSLTIQLQQRDPVLTQPSSDLANLLNSMSLPLLLLDNKLQIRQFTPPVQRLLNVRARDIGRSIGDVRLQLSIEDIQPLLHEVLETLGPREVEVQDREGRWYLLRVRPYRTAENKIEGLVVVLVDIDQLRRSQQHLMDARDFARCVVESAPVPIVVLNEDLTVRTANAAFRGLARMQLIDLEGRSLPDLALRLWGVAEMQAELEKLLLAQPGTLVEFEHAATPPHDKWLQIKAQMLSTDGSRVLLMMVEDITLRREAERLLASQKEVLEGEIEVAARNLNRTQDELRDLTNHLFTVQEDERQHLARELHDDVSQRLSLLEILLHEVNGAANPVDMEKLEAAREQCSKLNADVRQISHRLHPAILNDLGLSAALNSLVKEFGERENMPATYFSQNLPQRWSPEAATAIYRIAQEALRNVAKHAGKTHVKAVLSGTPIGIQLKVMDFGIGFDQETEMPAPGLGMISMQERARLAGGTVVVQSALGHGTTVTADIPLVTP